MKDLNFAEKKLLEELKKLNEQKKEIELRLNIIRLAKSASLLPQEGSTISYKLGKILLDTKFRNLHLLPSKLLALRIYSKHRKGLIKLSESELLEIEEKMRIFTSNTREPLIEEININSELERINVDSKKFDIGNKNKQTPKKEVTSISNEVTNNRISSILALTNHHFFSIYKRLYPTYALIENNSIQVNTTKSNVLIIDSVWAGIDKNWEYALLSKSLQSIQAKNLINKINILKNKGVKTVFIYREKEKHYETFKSIMNHSDIILTNSNVLLNRISADFKDTKIGIIPDTIIVDYANPSNPVPFQDKKEICYIGEYHKDFNDDDPSVLDKFLNKKGIITAFHKEDSYHPSYKVGDWEFIAKDKEFSDITKQFKFTFYVASESESSIPQKIIDSLACGVPVICTRSSYLENTILKDIMIFVDDIQQVEDILKKYENQRWEYTRYSHQCYRFAMNNFPAGKLKSCLEKEINNKNVTSNDDPLVSIIMASMREKYIDRIVTNISRQSYKNKEFIIITQGFSVDGVASLRQKLSKIKDLKRFQIVENNTSATLGERQNQAANYAKGSLLAKFDDDDFYFENYLSDMVLPFKFGNYDLVGKAEVFFYLEALNKTVLIRDGRAAYREMDFVSGATFVIKKSTFDKLGGFVELNQSEDSNLLKRLKESGGKIYSSDPFNFVVFRSKDVSNHTWQQKAEAFANSSLHIGEGIPTNIVAI